MRALEKLRSEAAFYIAAGLSEGMAEQVVALVKVVEAAVEVHDFKGTPSCAGGPPCALCLARAELEKVWGSGPSLRAVESPPRGVRALSQLLLSKVKKP